MKNSRTEDLYILLVDDYEILLCTPDLSEVMDWAQDQFAEYLNDAIDLDPSEPITQDIVDDSYVMVYKFGERESISCDFQEWADEHWKHQKLKGQEKEDSEYQLYLELKAKYE